MQLTLWTYEGPPHVGAMRVAAGDDRAALCAARAARRHLRRSPVHDDRAPPRAAAGHLHDLPGARSRRRHRRAVQDGRARSLRALPAAGDDRRRLLHRRVDPGRSRRPRPRARSADPGHSARTAGLSEEGELGRGGNFLPPRAIARRPAASGRPRRAKPLAIFSARRRSASAIATTSTKSPAPGRSASTSASPRRSARRPPT